MAQRPQAVFVESQEWVERVARPGLEKVLCLSFYPEPLDQVPDAALAEAEVLSVFIRSRVTEEALARLPRLRLVATRSTGYDHVDLAACQRRGVTVINVPRYGANTVAEHTFALILALSRNVHRAWFRSRLGDLVIADLLGFDLQGKTLGVVGAGDIGLHVIRIARGFGMHVLATDVRQDPLLAEVLGFQYVPLEQLLAHSDIVTLHAPLLPSTHHLLNREAFRKMKRGALLINTARGGLVDTEALLWALDEGILAGAGLDVLEGEDLAEEEGRLVATPGNEEALRHLMERYLLQRRDNVVVTPHIAFYSREALDRIAQTTVEGIQAFLEGRPINTVAVPSPQHLP